MKYYKVKTDYYYSFVNACPYPLIKNELLTINEYSRIRNVPKDIFEEVYISKFNTFKNFSCRFEAR